jgi:transmembrane sensor
VLEVLVTEGRVRVDDTRRNQSALPAPAADASPSAEPPQLVAGERAMVPLAPASSATSEKSATATVERVPPGVVQRALAWQERRLEFDAATLADVAREFNRYNHKQLVIADPALAARHFSGTFRADGYESFVRLLEADFGVSATTEGRDITLRVRR